VWIGAVVILARDGDVLFCAQVFGGVLLAAILLSATGGSACDRIAKISRRGAPAHAPGKQRACCEHRD
jgi:hypothetical protein